MKTYEAMSDGRVTYSMTELSEYLSNDTYRTTKTVVRDGKTVVSEVVQTGTARYCREDRSEWTTSGCYRQPPPPLEPADENRFEVQTNENHRTLIRTAVSQKKEANKSGPTQFITEDRFVLNGDMSVRERSIVKSVNGAKSIVFREISKFEYGVTLPPIEAPIK